jgi:hypothetical protein
VIKRSFECKKWIKTPLSYLSAGCQTSIPAEEFQKKDIVSPTFPIFVPSLSWQMLGC